MVAFSSCREAAAAFVSSISRIGNEFSDGTQRVNDLKAELLEMIDRARYMVEITYEENLPQTSGSLHLRVLQAYIYLLEDVLLEDGILSAREDEILRGILMGNDGRRTNEAVFKTNQAAYDEFAYALGLAYYYYYQINISVCLRRI